MKSSLILYPPYSNIIKWQLLPNITAQKITMCSAENRTNFTEFSFSPLPRNLQHSLILTTFTKNTEVISINISTSTFIFIIIYCTNYLAYFVCHCSLYSHVPHTVLMSHSSFTIPREISGM